MRSSFIRAALAAITIAGIPAFGATCDSLSKISLPKATVTSAQVVAAGQYQPPASSRGGNYKNLPEFCQVKATLKPTADSDIHIELWLPASGWNGKFQGTTGGGANGALEGGLDPGSMAEPLRNGFAIASTDTGHEGATMAYALEHPERLVDFGHRAVHEMTVAGKAIVKAFYGEAPKKSYWVACASGGRYGLMEAQRYPADYDGIVVSAPASHWTHLQSQSLWVYQATHPVIANAAADIPTSKYPVIHKAAIEACDAADGLKDGLIGDPRKCKFDPGVIECKGADGPNCLTSAQVAAARKIYQPLVNPRTKSEVFPGLLPGSELQWAGLANGDEIPRYVRESFRYLAFKDAEWDFRKRPVDFDKDVATMDKNAAGIMNAVNPDLKAFFGRGGKLITWTGWSDGLIAPEDLLNYYKNVADKMGGSSLLASGVPGSGVVDNSMRLYMVPGVHHCRGGDGPDTFDMISVIQDWVEQGKAPGTIVASHATKGQVDRTRPICAYPLVAKYKGTGSVDEAANFSCQMP
jgi:feruloyl esterase